jgi:hypothetical protein
MQLTPETETALNEWVGRESWDSDHPTDRRRFYRLVDQYRKDHGYSINERDLRHLIKRKVQAQGHSFGPHQEELLHEYVGVARDILEFSAAVSGSWASPAR